MQPRDEQDGSYRQFETAVCVYCFAVIVHYRIGWRTAVRLCVAARRLMSNECTTTLWIFVHVANHLEFGLVVKRRKPEPYNHSLSLMVRNNEVSQVGRRKNRARMEA